MPTYFHVKILASFTVIFLAGSITILEIQASKLEAKCVENGRSKVECKLVFRGR